MKHIMTSVTLALGFGCVTALALDCWDSVVSPSASGFSDCTGVGTPCKENGTKTPGDQTCGPGSGGVATGNTCEANSGTQPCTTTYQLGTSVAAPYGGCVCTGLSVLKTGTDTARTWGTFNCYE